ncbi:MAG: hypothetical protein JXJ30_05490 [Halothiobacillaceae bacterium]|nr:hypothetical protein [Halothiobacillaceae bacterium]HER34273.1 hypothetical protein [Halothiobacillaceae bacterium]
MQTYHDDVIDFWANIFRACRLSTTGLDLETFLEAPAQHLERLGLSDAVEMLAGSHLPLLPEQAAVRREIDARFPHAPAINPVPQSAATRAGAFLPPPTFLATAS